MPFVGLADMDAHQGALAFKFFVRHGDSVTSDRPLVSRWFCINHSLIYTVFYLVDNCVWECRSVLPFFSPSRSGFPKSKTTRIVSHSIFRLPAHKWLASRMPATLSNKPATTLAAT